MDARALGDLTLDDSLKGVPPGTPTIRLTDVARLGWNVLRGDLPVPAAILKQSALEHNGRWMRRFVEMANLRFAPHGKTTMSPQLFARQLDDGAWAITLATVSQVRVARRFGVARILLANQLVDPCAIRYVLGELRQDLEFDFYCLVDSVRGATMLGDVARDACAGRPLQVLVEVGVAGGRTGCRTADEALRVSRAVRAEWPHVALRGVEGFEGIIAGKDADDTEARVRDFLDTIGDAARRIAAEDLFTPGPILLTAGGSAFFDLVADILVGAKLGRESVTVIRSGCYLTQDAIQYQRAFDRILARSGVARRVGEGLRNALELCARVQSRPEPTRAILTFGKRDASYDSELPRPLWWYRRETHRTPQPLDPAHTVVALNDQHAYLNLPERSPLEVGDLIGLGVSHPCTTFDKWQVLAVVDDAYDVVGAVRTFF